MHNLVSLEVASERCCPEHGGSEMVMSGFPCAKKCFTSKRARALISKKKKQFMASHEL